MVTGDNVGKQLLGISVKLWIILYNRVNHAHFLLNWSGGHSNDVSISVILSRIFLLHGRFRTNLAALCCIISILFMSFRWYGSQIAAAYSSTGKINCL